MPVQPGPPRTHLSPVCSVISRRLERQSTPWNPPSLPSFSQALSSFHLSSYFSNHVVCFILLLLPFDCFVCFSSSVFEQEKQTVTVLPPQLDFLSSFHTCLPSLMHVFVHLFSTCLSVAGSGCSVVDLPTWGELLHKLLGSSNLGESYKGCLQVFVIGSPHPFEGIGELSQSRLLQDLSKQKKQPE